MGAPQLGFVLGALAGNILSPTQLPGQSGPKLSDGQTTTSVVGAPVPILFGTASLSGTFMWLAPIVQTTNTQSVGGKGGPSQTNTTYTYTQSVAVGLCEGPIAGISRIWENGTLVYDIRPQLVAEIDADYAARLSAAAIYAETFSLHLGDETQVADATIESIEGMGNVPAFRGLAYIVYPDRKLLDTQALRHPAFKFEAYESGAGNCESEDLLSQSVLYPWLSSGLPNPNNTNTYQILLADPAASHFDATPITGNFHYTSLNDALVVTNAMYDAPYDTFLTYALTPDGGIAVTSMVGGGVCSGGNGGIAINPAQYHSPDPSDVQLFFGNSAPTDGIFNALVSPSDHVMVTVNAKWEMGGRMYLNSGVVVGGAGPPLLSPWCNVVSFGFGYPYFAQGATNVVINVHRDPGPPLPLCTGLSPSVGNPGFAVQTDGLLIQCNNWELEPVGNYLVLQIYVSRIGEQDNAVVQYPLNPVLPQGDARSTEAFWTAAYLAAVADGSMQAGLTYDAAGAGGHYPVLVNFTPYGVTRTICQGAGGDVTLGHIIRAICARAGFAPTDIDASDMDAITVNGYTVATVSAGRDILTPLRSVGFFDCVESGSTLKFVARGKPIVASLTTDDFGAYDGSATGGTPGPSITTIKAQDADLPLQTRVHYFATSRDYEDGEQLSPTRLTTTAVNVVDVELAVCMDDNQAAQIAEVLWADAWAERWSGTLAVDQAWSELEPGDCIEVPVDGVTRRIRLVNESVASGVLRTLNYVRDDDEAYVSHAVAAVPSRVPQKLKLLSATDLELLDLPPLTDADNDAGIYASARGSTLAGNSWGGCVVFRSSDGGATFSQMGSITTTATMGILHAAVTPSDWHTWDDVTTITVDVVVGVTFESRTDAAVLAGANAAAMGADGRWEIAQFANATQLSPTQWRLSRLLRGRRGTEHNISSSQAGDRLVMVSTGALVRFPLQVSEIGASRIYKAVSIGASYASGIDQTFAGQGVALRPFSPVFLTAERGTGGDIVLHWVRRGRLGRTLMSGVDIPLSEATESYSVDIYTHTSPHTVVRTIAASTPTATYTAAQQTADFGSDTESSLMVAVYQISASVGRGTPDVQNLTIS